MLDTTSPKQFPDPAGQEGEGSTPAPSAEPQVGTPQSASVSVRDAEIVQVVTVQGGYVESIVGKVIHQHYATPSPAERERALRALLHDHSGFIASRMEAFVGREVELAEISARIAEKQPTGGYVTITGQAGQGKSSVIAKLVAGALDDGTNLRLRLLEPRAGVPVCHFIPFSPGPDHQVGLLRNLLARLCLTYGLPDFYATSDSRPALRDYFAAALRDLAKQGCQEVIYIDGLDQIEEDVSGVRDLSFLPEEPPVGVVFVLGTRPNDTLKPLELRKPQHEYWLPNLSRGDFNLILQHRGVALTSALADRFYAAMQENALYLDLVARELAQADSVEPEQIIARVADNPANLFSLSIKRLQRNERQWDRVLRPILGLLLATRTPLSQRALRAQIGADDLRSRQGLERLGGLIQCDSEGHYGLFHLKFGEFLRHEMFAYDEEEGYHQRLVDWCEGGKGGIGAIWQEAKGDALEQERRAYARQHYIAHLAAARSYERLWVVIDTGQYGRAKCRYDPSTRGYVLDLDIVRQAVIDVLVGDLDTQAQLLSRLWRYSLLRCILTSQIDAWPEELFTALVMLERGNEAHERAEMLNDITKQAKILTVIGLTMLVQGNTTGENVLNRALTIIDNIVEGQQRNEALGSLIIALVKVGRFKGALTLVNSITDQYTRHNALRDIAIAFARDGRFRDASAIINKISFPWIRDEVLCGLAIALAQASHINKANAVAKTISAPAKRATVHAVCAVISAQTGNTAQSAAAIALARTDIDAIDNDEDINRAEALRDLATALAQLERETEADEVFAEARATASYIFSLLDRADFLRSLAIALAQTGRVESAQATAKDTTFFTLEGDVLRSAENHELMRYYRIFSLYEVANALSMSGYWGAACATIDDIPKSHPYHALALIKFAVALARNNKELEAAEMFTRAQNATNTISKYWKPAPILASLCAALAEAGRVIEAGEVLNATLAIAVNSIRHIPIVRSNIAISLAKAKQWDSAHAIACTIQDEASRDNTLRKVDESVARTSAIAPENNLVVEKAVGVAVILAQQGRWKEFYTSFKEISDSKDCADVVSRLVNFLAQEGSTKEAVHLIANAWRCARTLDEMERLTKLDSESLCSELALGSAFVDGLTWVDTELAQISGHIGQITSSPKLRIS